MFPEYNQNFNNPMPQQPVPEKKSAGLNTILLVLLIALVGFGIWVMGEKRETQTQQIIQQEQQNTEIPINETDEQSVEQVKSAYGITVFVPDGFEFFSSLSDYDTKLVSITSPSNNQKAVIIFIKYPNLAGLEQDSAGNNTVEFDLVNPNYSIGGSVGSYYVSKNGASSYIVIPSKLVQIYVSPSSLPGVDQIVLDEILGSVKFD